MSSTAHPPLPPLPGPSGSAGADRVGLTELATSTPVRREIVLARGIEAPARSVPLSDVLGLRGSGMSPRARKRWLGAGAALAALAAVAATVTLLGGNDRAPTPPLWLADPAVERAASTLSPAPAPAGASASSSLAGVATSVRTGATVTGGTARLTPLPAAPSSAPNGGSAVTPGTGAAGVQTGTGATGATTRTTPDRSASATSGTTTAPTTGIPIANQDAAATRSAAPAATAGTTAAPTFPPPTTAAPAPTTAAPPTAPAPTFPPPTTAAPAPPVADGVLSGVGGSVRVRCIGSEIQLLSTSASAGFQYDVKDAGPDRVRVELWTSSWRTRLEGRCENGSLRPDVSDESR